MCRDVCLNAEEKSVVFGFARINVEIVKPEAVTAFYHLWMYYIYTVNGELD